MRKELHEAKAPRELPLIPIDCRPDEQQQWDGSGPPFKLEPSPDPLHICLSPDRLIIPVTSVGDLLGGKREAEHSLDDDGQRGPWRFSTGQWARDDGLWPEGSHLRWWWRTTWSTWGTWRRNLVQSRIPQERIRRPDVAAPLLGNPTSPIIILCNLDQPSSGPFECWGWWWWWRSPL